jgi:Na+-translocating ferredoxin:NAD+ oxidoreductase RnfE subunit
MRFPLIISAMIKNCSSLLSAASSACNNSLAQSLVVSSRLIRSNLVFVGTVDNFAGKSCVAHSRNNFGSNFSRR